MCVFCLKPLSGVFLGEGDALTAQRIVKKGIKKTADAQAGVAGVADLVNVVDV